MYKFDWKLPNLEMLKLKNFRGQLRVPQSVANLELLVKNRKWLEDLVVPHILDYCDIRGEEDYFNRGINMTIARQRGKIYHQVRRSVA